MRRLVTGKQMKEIDYHGIEVIGIPSLVLMERAALAVADAMEVQQRGLMKDRVLILCGTGNNGADGAALGRILFLRGISVTVATVGQKDRWTREMEQQIAIDRKLGVPVIEWGRQSDVSFDVVVDALFGVGLDRDVAGVFAAAMEDLDRIKPRFTVAVDIPSGISGETGAVLGRAVKADLTVTFGFEKVGMCFYPGRSFCGRVEVADIGFPAYDGYGGPRYFAPGVEDGNRIPERQKDSHKGTYGRVLVVAGSEGMCGAAYLSALAAYRTGAGLVKILTVRSNVQPLQALLPEAIISSYTPRFTEEEPEAFEKLIENECAWASVIVLGPGLGKARYVKKMVQCVLLSAYVPIIVDADGLNVVAEYPHLAGYFTENVIVTPHLGEMSRLTEMEIDDLKRDLPGAAARYSEEKGVTCVLKDAITVTACRDGSIYIGDSGCSAMSKGGSGDVLTGVIAGLIALGLTEEEAAAMGVWVHGMAGQAAAIEKGSHSVLARDIAAHLLDGIHEGKCDG